MNFFQKLFGSKEETTEEKRKEDVARNFEVLKYDGVRALKSGETAYAIKCFQHALEIKDDLEIHDYLSQAFVRTNELLQAFDELQKLAEAQPDNQQIFIRMANVAFMMEDYSAMSGACEKALLLDKDNPVVSFLYAEASRGQGDDVNAVAMATKAIALDPNYGEAYLLRSEILLSMGDLAGANEDAEWLIEHTDGQEEVLLLKARIERKRPDLPAAIDYYTNVLEANPFNLEAYKERGAVRLEQGDKEGAAKDMEKVLELSPKETADITGEYSAEGIEEKTRRAYHNNPQG